MIKSRDNQGQRIRPSSSTSGSTNQERPVFSLIHLQPRHALNQCNKNEKAAFADTLHQLSKMTWGQIQQAPRHGLGSEIISHSSMRVGIPPVITPEVRIIAFRCHGQAPMVGFRDGAIFHVVWMDRDFTVYDHGG
ncbi:MAG: hypothetical protein HQL82_01620 [Magnetococcales bacterium]|nr:hypothetical protein [Magnetococcales bacterium]